MASSSPNRLQVLRAAAILTNSEVKSSSFDINQADSAGVELQFAFTLGSLTNGLFKFYVSDDGSTWIPHEDGAGALLRTFTANAAQTVAIYAPGWKFLCVGVTGTGTVTSSTATITARYLRRGSQR
jgi:hypothetical protein